MDRLKKIRAGKLSECTVNASSPPVYSSWDSHNSDFPLEAIRDSMELSLNDIYQSSGLTDDELNEKVRIYGCLCLCLLVSPF